jgi:hypothetical protein
LGHAKGQVASLDIVIAVAAILFFIALIVLFFPIKPKDAAIYNSKAFLGIESADPPYAFLNGYVVNESSLGLFATLSPTQMETIVLNSTEFTGYTSDICIFFADGSNIWQINMMDTLGQVYQDDAHTITGACSISNPCQHYSKTSVYTRPVARNYHITNMHVVVCS